jgi:D-glycero-alpha-D-manno-heptose-7-phosphate kinase|tara:strand:- start:7341 stop:8357 length:1017 start_codon:yes stop_codon:yes gene_type:complete
MPNVTALPRAVTTITPQRIGFAGGGTDFPEFYRAHGGAVLSSTIDKYIYVTVKRHSTLFNENYRLSYSQTEHVNSVDEIENDIARECLRLVDVEPPLFIATASDLPVSSGLGSSSSFAVGLLYALHTLRGEDVSAGQLAEEACHVELDVLGHPIGKQDQYAAAFGGLNYLSFQKDDRVQIDSVWLPGVGADGLFQNIMLFWTGIQRDANAVLREQSDNIFRTSNKLIEMRDMAGHCRDLLLKNPENIGQLGALLDSGWKAKRSLASTIASSETDVLYERALEGGAVGGKIAGAGGGGFLLLVVPTDRKEAVRAALPGMLDVSIAYEPRGARLLSVVPG